MDYNALILGQSSSHCSTGRCASLATFVETSRIFKQVHEESGSLPNTTPFIPDVILLRFCGDDDAQALIESCRRKWNCASILALFCCNSKAPMNDVLAVLGRLDDFAFCTFQQAEFSFRVQYLLQSNKRRSVSTASQKFGEELRDLPLVGESPAFLRVVKKIPPLARVDQTVLISGETGSGKEVIARAIHYQGPRHGKPFIPVNCGALPDHLFENEVFGHAKGAFTDASSAEKGLIAEAEGGTLFLDEIDSLSMSAQVKLLRFLENGEYRPLGSSTIKIADVRVIAATNTNLVERIKARAFREDLYYRLNTLSLFIPPLRDRISDVVHLANHFLVQHSREHDREPRRISKGALGKLMAYSWPGNVRELEGVIRGALILTSRQTLEREDIDLPLRDFEDTPGNSSRQAMKGSVETFERDYLRSLLARYRGNITHAAQAAGKQRRTLQRLLRKYSLDRRMFRL